MNHTAAGIVGLLCDLEDHFYLFSSQDVDRDTQQLLDDLKRGRSTHLGLLADWKKHGPDGFDVTMLEEMDSNATQEQLQKRLASWLILIPYAEAL